jgi:hypothetical protein
MTRVKIFTDIRLSDLEKSINNFTTNGDNRIEVVDIKYNQSVTRLAQDEFDSCEVFYSAMVIYEPEYIDKAERNGYAVRRPL